MRDILKQTTLCMFLLLSLTACCLEEWFFRPCPCKRECPTESCGEPCPIDSVIVIPSAPTSVTLSAGNGQVMVTWDSVSGATSYNIYWANVAGVTKSNGTKIADKPSPYIHIGLTNDIPYYYVVTAVNSAGESAVSSEVFDTPTLAPPPPP